MQLSSRRQGRQTGNERIHAASSSEGELVPRPPLLCNWRVSKTGTYKLHLRAGRMMMLFWLANTVFEMLALLRLISDVVVIPSPFSTCSLAFVP